MKNCVAIIAPVSAQRRSCSYFRPETVFLGAHNGHIAAENIAQGVLLLGPEGTVEVTRVSREPCQPRDIASVDIGGEVFTVFIHSQVAAVAQTENLVGGAELAYYEIRELQAGTHEV